MIFAQGPGKGLAKMVSVEEKTLPYGQNPNCALSSWKDLGD